MLDPKDWLPGLTVYSAFPAAFVTPAGTGLTVTAPGTSYADHRLTHRDGTAWWGINLDFPDEPIHPLTERATWRPASYANLDRDPAAEPDGTQAVVIELRAALAAPAGTVLTKNGERFVIDDTRAWYDEWPECRTHLAPLAPVAAPTTKPLADGRWRDDYDVPAEPVLDDEDGPLEADECWRRYLRDPRSCDPCQCCTLVIDWAEAAFEEAERRVELKARMWRLGL